MATRLSNTSQRVAKRNVGGSLAFNGSSSYVSLGAKDLSLNDGVSLESWAYKSDNGSMAIWGADDAANEMEIDVLGEVPRALINGTIIARSTTILKKGWSHIVYTRNQTTKVNHIYVNNIDTSLDVNLTTNPYSTSASVKYIGARTSATSLWKGRIHSVRLYSRDLSSNEVSNLYFNNVVPRTGLVGEWLFSEGSGTTVVDTSGNGNNGTITAGTWSTDRPFANSNSVQDIKASASGDSTSPVGSIDTTTSGAGTVMMWLKTASQTGVTVFGLVGADGITDAWRFNCSSTYPFIWTTNTSGSGTGIFNSNSTFPNKIWTHVACTLTTDGVNTNGKIYINGQLIISSTLARDVKSVSRLVVYNNPDYKTTDVVAYERELSQAEILSHYNTSATPTIPKIKWERTEGVGNINYDTSGNLANSTGTLTWSSDTPSKSRKQVGGNMIPNGDFSYVPVVNVATTTSGKFIDGTVAGGASNIFGWLFTKSGTASSVFDVNNTYLGNPSLKASLSATASYLELFTSGVNNNIISYFGKSFIRVLPSTSYTLRYAMKTNYVSGDSSSGAYITIIGSNGDGSSSSSQTNGTPIKTTTDWTIYTVTWTTSATTRYAQINPVIYGHTAAGTLIMDAWFANITLTPTVNTTRSSV